MSQPDDTLRSGLERALSDAQVRETDMRDALCNAIAAMEAAVHISVMVNRGERSCVNSKPFTNAHVQNLLMLSLFHIKETTGIELAERI